MEVPTLRMQGPTVAALQEVLTDLEALPESDQRTKAIAKVKRQLADLEDEAA